MLLRAPLLSAFGECFGRETQFARAHSAQKARTRHSDCWHLSADTIARPARAARPASNQVWFAVLIVAANSQDDDKPERLASVRVTRKLSYPSEPEEGSMVCLVVVECP